MGCRSRIPIATLCVICVHWIACSSGDDGDTTGPSTLDAGDAGDGNTGSGGAGGRSGSAGAGGVGGNAGVAGAAGGGGVPVVECGFGYYVDANNGDDAWSGTLPSANATRTDGPWKTVGKVSSSTFQSGDDVYFRAGTTYTPRGDSAGLRIRWSGTADDVVVVGAYDDDGGTPRCGVESDDRPVFDFEDWTYPTGEWASGIALNGQSYVEVRDLYVRNPSRTGIEGGNSHHITIRNNYISDSGGAGIVVMRSHHSLIVGNTSEKAGGQVGGCQGAIVSGGNDKAGSTYDVVIRNNTVFHSKCEGIGLYKTGKNLIVEHNVVYDCENVNIYLDAVKDCTVRHNIVFSTAAGMPGSGNPRTSWGISTEIEQERCNQYPQTYPGDWNSGNAVYGNLIAGVMSGIRIASICGNSVDNKYYNNTIVGSERGFMIAQPKEGDAWRGNEIKNNIVGTYTTTDVHSNTYARPGVAWSNNLFFGGDAAVISGTDAASDAVFDDASLNKVDGWKDLAPDAITASWWENQADSPAVDRGVDLGSTFATDFDGVTRPQGAAWDIGAFER